MIIFTARYYEQEALGNLKEAVQEQTCAAWDKNESWLNESRPILAKARRRCRELRIPQDTIDKAERQQREASENELRKVGE
jgi:hypothetical protein